jgi:hypothetical protein
VRELLRQRAALWQGFFQDFGQPGREIRDALPRYRDARSEPFPGEWPAPLRRVPLWGWKDPRNTLTLGLWLRVFPDARVVHVVRHGIDVALSLERRARERGVGAPECLDASFCFRLWERYLERGCRWRSLPRDRYCEVRYEDLLDPSSDALAELLRSSGAPPPAATEAAALIVRARPIERADHPTLTHPAATSAWLHSLGYG